MINNKKRKLKPMTDGRDWKGVKLWRKRENVSCETERKE